MIHIPHRWHQKTQWKSDQLGRLWIKDKRDVNYPVRSQIPSKSEREARGYKYYWAEGYHGNQGRNPTCFLPGTKITMADGSEKAIEDICAGERVLTPEGNSKMVEACMAREYEGEVVKMKARGYTRPLVSTPEHPWLVSNLSPETSRNSDVPKGRLSASDPDWMEAGDIEPYQSGEGGPSLNIPRVKPDIDPEPVLNVDSFIDDHRIHKEEGKIRLHGCRQKGTIPETVPVSLGLGRLIGLYLAEGCVRTDRNASLHLTFGSHEEDLAEEAASLIEDIFGVETHHRHRPSNVIHLNGYSSTLAALMEGLVGNGCENKGFDSSMWTWPDHILEKIWSGFQDGDGHLNKKGDKITLTTVSSDLARDLWRLGNRLGYMPLMNVSHSEDKKKAFRVVCTRVSDMEEKGEMKDVNRTRKWNDRYIHCPVTDVSREEYEGLVFNLQVADDRSYIADGFAVHNCVAYSLLHLLDDGSYTHFYKNREASPQYTGDQNPLINPHRLYEKAQKHDKWPGTEYQGTSVRGGLKALQKEYGAIDSYHWADSIEDIVDALLHVGPVAVGSVWLRDMFSPKKKDDKYFINVSGDMVGGHAYLLNGINKSKGIIRVKNSWGSSWAGNGMAYIDIEDLDKLLFSDQYWNGEAAVVKEDPVDSYEEGD